jgi:signal transduction histidine kinase
MLQELITRHRDAIVRKSRTRATPGQATHSESELESGVAEFLTQLSECLQAGITATPVSTDAIRAGAARQGGHLRALGFTVAQVVHEYGGICQAIADVGLAQRIPISTEEFCTLNRCLDAAIAEAVTEHGRAAGGLKSGLEIERIGQLTNDIRSMLDTALLAFGILKRGAVAINGSTGQVLGRTLMGLHDLVDSTMSDVRMAGNRQRRERVAVTSLLNDLTVAASLHAEYLGLQFAIEPIDVAWTIDADPQLLASAVTNLLNNAFKYTRAGGSVTLRARNEDGRLLIEVEDQCGGIPASEGDPLHRGRATTDSDSRGLGLSIARDAVRAHGGDIYIRNMPGAGCAFVIEVPLSADAWVGPPAAR